jgi:glycosyltransferase involved in cell wall biosynthesis
MNIAFFTSESGGCTYYRAILPLNTLHERDLASVMRLPQGETKERVAHAITHADVLVYLRMIANERMVSIMQTLKEDGKLTVVDYDDNVFEVTATPFSPHYADYGTKEVSTMSGGNMVDVWKNGENGFDVERNKERLKLIEEALRQAGLITTTTEYLANILRQYNPNVAVLPNCVDLGRWRRAKVEPEDRIKMFWAGGSSHYEDWLLLKDVLVEVLHRFPRLHLVLMGIKFEHILKELPSDRVEFHPWEDNLSYPLRVSLINPDFCIIPLADNEFNRSKSPIKFVEMGALSVPCVMSEVGPYKSVYNGKNAILVRNNNHQAWVDAISFMVRNPLERRLIGSAARQYVLENHDIAKQCKLWVDAYEAYRAKLCHSFQLATS